MHLVVGLGNPGRQYATSRHNVGFMTVDLLARSLGLRFVRGRARTMQAAAVVGFRRIVLAKPLTYMNLSGYGVASLAGYYRIAPAQVLVVCDDMDLPLGALRLRAQGSSGGHNGLQSIIDTLGTREFPRLRLGIGRPASVTPVDFVLSRFSRPETAILRETLPAASAAIRLYLESGIEKAMNDFNGWNGASAISDNERQ